MLVLIAGITGNLGQKIATSLLARGHRVRGVGRSPAKLPAQMKDDLESFVQSFAYYDVEALEKACEGVDAVICAYQGTPELQLDGQLLLLRTAERAGVRRYIAASWNYDWRDMKLGEHESYDPYLCFRRQVELSSTIKPTYIFTGVLAEVLFSVPGHGDFSPTNNGVFDPEKKEMHVWGPKDRLWHWTTERDAAEFTAEIVQQDGVENGGFWTVCSGVNTLENIAKIYGDIKNCKIDVVHKGTLEALERRAVDARRKGSVARFWEYIGWFYQLFTANGHWVLGGLDNERLEVQTTPLVNFLRDDYRV